MVQAVQSLVKAEKQFRNLKGLKILFTTLKKLSRLRKFVFLQILRSAPQKFYAKKPLCFFSKLIYWKNQEQVQQCNYLTVHERKLKFCSQNTYSWSVFL